MGSATGTRYDGNMDEEERKAKAADAARRFEQATADIAAEGRFGGPDAASTELEMMDEAAALIAEARFVEHDPLSRFGGDRDRVRMALLLSNEIEVVLEDKGIVADADLRALLDGRIEEADLDALRAALERLKAR